RECEILDRALGQQQALACVPRGGERPLPRQARMQALVERDGQFAVLGNGLAGFDRRARGGLAGEGQCGCGGATGHQFEDGATIERGHAVSLRSDGPLWWPTDTSCNKFVSVCVRKVSFSSEKHTMSKLR